MVINDLNSEDSSTLFIIAPAYNEEENICEFVDSWYPIIESHNPNGKSQFVVVCDGSTDKTYEILCEMAKNKPFLVPMTKENEGHGATLLFGYNYALKNGANYIFQTDSDGQTDPMEFEKFWNDRENYSASFGKRSKRGDGYSRALVEKILCFILKLFFGVSITDANAPYRLMKSSYLNKYIPLIPDKYNLPNVVLTMLGVYYHDKVRFIEISFKPRQGGVNSINIPKIAIIGKQALVDFGKIKRKLGNVNL